MKAYPAESQQRDRDTESGKKITVMRVLCTTAPLCNQGIRGACRKYGVDPGHRSTPGVKNNRGTGVGSDNDRRPVFNCPQLRGDIVLSRSGGASEVVVVGELDHDVGPVLHEGADKAGEQVFPADDGRNF